ncbi:MAG TPA: hypothetical protein PKW07_08225 [Syntrophorhabdaceae bacterium]|nr:hypothetical protein [Syntrophorhabdaceae bacterium]
MITGIGSLPFTDIDKALDLIFSACSEIPFWPQLPKRSPDENMYSTFLESVPCIVSDREKNTVFINTEETEGIETFYEDVANNNIHAFAISDRAAPGFYRFLERLKDISLSVSAIKGQLTGPFSMGLGLKDEKGVPVIYNFAYFDIIKKALHMKAQWMIDTIRSYYPDKNIIIFFDEPYMVSFGTAYVSIGKQDAISIFNEVIDGIDATIGIHCCGNTDWSVLLNTHVNIINYDAFNYMDTIFYFKNELKDFLKKGGLISPGIVPSSEVVLEKSVQDMMDLLKRFKKNLGDTKEIYDDKAMLITTSCGLGSLSDKEALKAMELLKGLSDF